MIPVSNEVRKKINNGSAKTHAKIVIDDRVFGYDNKNETAIPKNDGSIYKLNVQYDISKEEFAIGTSCIQMCEVSLYGVSDFEFERKYLKIYIGYELDEKFTVDGMRFPKIEWIPMGAFFTTEVIKKGKWVSFVGYDRTYKNTDMVYVPSKSLGDNPTVYDVFMDIFKFTGAPYDAESFENMMHARVDMKQLYGTDENGNTTGYTVRDAMAFLSGKVGCSIIVNRYDKFQLLDYSFAVFKVDMGDGMYYEDGEYRITDNIISDAEIAGDGIHGMRYIDVMNSSSPVRYDNGNTDYKNGIVIDSSIITTENEAKAVLDHINNIYSWKGGTFYMTPCSFRLLNGDITLELGDIISYVPINTYALGEQTYIPIMHMGVNYTGKPEVDIAAYNRTQTQQENRTTPIQRAISAFRRATNNKYKYLDEAIQIVSNQITGANGGYIVVDKNEDGSWRQMRVLDDIENPQTAIVINKNGIGFSQDGGSTMDAAAITIDGKLVANSMTGGVLQAAQGYIGGWNISDTKISGGDTSKGEKTAVMQLPPTAEGGRQWVFAAGGSNHYSYSDCPFRVDYRGKLYATDADISGKITADTGKIAGWTIANGYLQSTNSSRRVRIKAVSGNTGNVFEIHNTANNSTIFYINGNGQLYVGTNATFKSDANFSFAKFSEGINLGYLPAGSLYVNSNGAVCSSSSSKRYKENITEELPFELDPNALYDLPVVSFNYKDEFTDKSLIDGIQIGLIAEDVAEIFPNAAIYNKDGKVENWQERIMIPAMLKLIQEQKKQIDDLEKRIKALEEGI